MIMRRSPGDKTRIAVGQLQKPHAMTGETRLEDLRVEIDHLDGRIHRLLMRRAEVAARVGASKRIQADGKVPLLFRPAREAQILRRLLARHRGPLPRAVLQDVWRGIIAGNLALQGGTVVTVTPGMASQIARDHFRSCVTLEETPHPASALAAVTDRRAAVAVLPFPGDSAGAGWWPDLLKNPTLHIVGQIPVLRGLSAPTAALVAEQPPEASGEDVTLMVASAPAAPTGAARAVATGFGGLRLLALEGLVPEPPDWAGPGARVIGVVAAGVT